MPTPCLTCGQIIEHGRRCKQCKRLFERQRNNKATRQAYRDPLYRSYVKADKCEICGSTEDLTKDHKQPISKGGTNDPSNLTTLCRRCNSSKGTTYT